MVFKKGSFTENRVYLIVAVVIVVVIIFTVFFSGRELFSAYVPYSVTGDVWVEDVSEHECGSELMGVESWCSFTYRNDDSDFPAYLSVTTFKNMFMLSEEELWDKTLSTVEKASDQGVVLNASSEVMGWRVLKDGVHKTRYVVYDGVQTVDNVSKNVKIVGECWNCGESGTSVICIGFSVVSKDLFSSKNVSFWGDIVRDSEGSFGDNSVFMGDDGLIFNVRCH